MVLKEQRETVIIKTRICPDCQLMKSHRFTICPKCGGDMGRFTFDYYMPEQFGMYAQNRQGTGACKR